MAENISDIEKIDQVDFNKKGNKELIIYYNHSMGLSFWTHGWQEHEKGFLIFDVDNFNLLADIKNYSSHLNWSNEFDPDESDTLAYEDRTLISSESDSDCYAYEVKFSESKIVLTENKECNDFTEGINNEIPEPKIITYRLKGNYLIKEK